ncbi:hypothetical protein Hanom_Chr01g00067921 [Helianthus anomalus]
MPTRSLMRMNQRIHQRLKRSLVLFHMVHPLILMLVCYSTFFIIPYIREYSKQIRIFGKEFDTLNTASLFFFRFHIKIVLFCY